MHGHMNVKSLHLSWQVVQTGKTSLPSSMGYYYIIHLENEKTKIITYRVLADIRTGYHLKTYPGRT